MLALAAAVRVEAAAQVAVVRAAVVRAAQAPRMVSDMAQIMAAEHRVRLLPRMGMGWRLPLRRLIPTQRVSARRLRFSAQHLQMNKRWSR